MVDHIQKSSLLFYLLLIYLIILLIIDLIDLARDDSHVIQSIVNDVWQKLALMYPNELKGIVHNDEHCEYTESIKELEFWAWVELGRQP
jgi:hypothetical protein